MRGSGETGGEKREESFCRFKLAFLLLLRRPALPLLLADGRIGVLSSSGDLHV